MIYLASPYKHEDKAVMEDRYKKTLEVTARLLLAGHHVFSPIVYGHHLAKEHKLPEGFGFWERFDTKFVLMCEEMYVLCLDDWQYSRGVLSEMMLASNMKKRIKLIYY